ncbi:MAG: hypothetical protein J6A79_02085, partial [Clostridia bacterium]|nr:hypothetical protein [Clostridia bacterium]
MSKNPFTLAICQLRTELVYEQTMQKTEAMVREAAAAGASLIVLPEMFDCPYDREYFHKFTAMGHE